MQIVILGIDIWQQLKVGCETNGLRDWVYRQNTEKGVAPAAEHVWTENMTWLAKDHTGALRPEKRPRWKRRQRNQWVLRWAHRSRVLRGTFKNGERLPLETLRAKAVNPKPTRPKNWQASKNTAPKMSPKSGLEIRTLLYKYIITGGRFPGLFLGPLFVALFICWRWNSVS